MSKDNELKPYPHQQETIDNLNAEFKKGNTKQLVVLPSGSGKTHTIAFHVKELRPGSFLYVVHRDQLVTQTIEVFKNTIPWLWNTDIGIINQENKDYEQPYLFATIQTLSHPKNLDRLRKKIDYVVIDEYHHVAAPSYKMILKHIKPKYLIGLTATPYRLDKKDIFSFVNNNIVNSIDLFQGISKKILVPFHYIGLHDDIDYTKIKFNGYQYHTGDLDRKLIIHKRDDAVIDEYFKKIDSDNRQSTIVFCNSVEHIKRMTDRFNKEGIRAAGIYHKLDIEEKRNIIDKFRQGFYNVLLTRDILNEGVDFPECNALMFLRPTISKTIFLQQLGRGLRKRKGKKDVLVLDFVGNYHKAFEKRHWFLSSADSKVDLKKYTGEYIKPIYEYDHPRPVIEFDSRVIEIMDLQERYYTEYGARTTTDEQKLKDNYFKVKKIWLEQRAQSKSNIRRYITKRIKDTRNYLPVTVLRDSKVSKYNVEPYVLKYGTYLNFLRAIGELPPEKEDLQLHGSDSKEVKFSKLLRLVKLLQKKLGRDYFTEVDWTREYGYNGLRFMKTEYGSIMQFREHLGIKNGIDSKCDYCHKLFLVKFVNKRGNNSFCSDECVNKYYGGVDPKTRKIRSEVRKEKLALKTKCLSCGKEINQYKYYEHTNITRKQTFCDRKCCLMHYNSREYKKQKQQQKQKIQR